MSRKVASSRLINVNKSQERERIETEDALKHMHACAVNNSTVSVESLAGALGIQRSLAGKRIACLEQAGLARINKGCYELTNKGLDYALQVIRAHRLYETYLARESGLKPEEWHRQAHIEEHHLSAADVDALADRLGHPRFDPHGDPIPTRAGVLINRDTINLLEWNTQLIGQIEHIEDEPSVVFQRIREAGLYPGMRLRILENSSTHVKLDCEGRVVKLLRDAAAHLSLREPDADKREIPFPERLADLPSGTSACVKGLSPYFRGPERTRLLDLGFVQGSLIERVFTSPLASPIAYKVRGAIIALRKEQAEHVYVRKVTVGSPTAIQT